MSRRDPSAASGQVAAPTPPPCVCTHAQAVHRLTLTGRRSSCSAFPCLCKTYREKP